jgi:hypothetical protein
VLSGPRFRVGGTGSYRFDSVCNFEVSFLISDESSFTLFEFCFWIFSATLCLRSSSVMLPLSCEMDLISTAMSFSRKLSAFISLDKEWCYQDQGIGGHIASC